MEKPTFDGDVDMVTEQAKDPLLMEVKEGLQNDRVPDSVKKKHIVTDDILYYISNLDADPTLQLYVPTHLRNTVKTAYHNSNGHFGTDKTFKAIKQKYYWPNTYKEICEYIQNCIICQTRTMQKITPPVQMTDTPPYPWAKADLDVSGPFPKSLSGNKYIVSFVDWYSGWPEAFAVPDKSADTIANLIIEEIYPRHGSVLELVCDNGTENIYRVVRETLQYLNIKQTATFYYRPQANSKVERFHRTLIDVLSKKLQDNLSTWDLYLNQTLAAIRFNISESSKFSLFYLLYNRDVVLPIDTILKPRRKYMGEDMHNISIEQQHKSFVLVHKHLERAKKRRA